MESDSVFLKQLREKRTSFSQSAEKYRLMPSAQPPISGIPLYYVEAAEHFQVTYPFYIEREGVSAYYILYTISGKGQLTYRGTTILLEPGSVFFIDCASKYRIEIFDQVPWVFTSVYINGPSVFYYYQTFSKRNHYLCHLSPLSPIEGILQDITSLLKTPVENYELHISKLVTDLMTTLADAKNIEEQMDNSVPKYVLEVKRQFDHNYDHNFSLDELAKLCRISKYQLSHEFTKHIGISPINYLIKRRLEGAKKLLSTTDETIGTVGLMVGIENTTHFINLFKKEVGVTPLQYRKFSASALTHN